MPLGNPLYMDTRKLNLAPAPEPAAEPSFEDRAGTRILAMITDSAVRTLMATRAHPFIALAAQFVTALELARFAPDTAQAMLDDFLAFAAEEEGTSVEAITARDRELVLATVKTAQEALKPSEPAACDSPQS